VVGTITREALARVAHRNDQTGRGVANENGNINKEKGEGIIPFPRSDRRDGSEGTYVGTAPMPAWWRN